MTNILKAALDELLAPARRIGQRTPPTRRAGVPGTAIYGGFIQPIERNAKLTGRERYRVYSDILANTSIVAAATRFFLNLVAKANWTVEPAEDSGERGEEVAELVEDILFKQLATPWHRVVRRAAMYRFYGFSWQEWTAVRREDGLIGYDDIEPRPQITIERWDRDSETGKVLGVIQRSPQSSLELYIPRSKSVYLVDDSLNDSPEGLGLFRHVVAAAERLTRYEQLEGWGFELDLRGVPLGRAPIAALEQAGLTEQEITDKLQHLSTFMDNHIKGPQLGLLLDSLTYESQDEASTPSSNKQWDLELMKGSSNSQAEVALAIQRLNREIARVLFAEGLLLGETGAGSLAMSRDKSENFRLMVDNSLKEIGESFDMDLIDPLMDLNGIPDELKPTLRSEKIQHRDVTEITTALKDLAASGALMMPDDPAINEVRQLLGLSPQDVTEIMIDSTLNSPAPAPVGDGELEEDPVDDVVDKVLLKPKKGESRKDFVSRFMANAKVRREFPDAKQRAAVANRTFRDKDKK